MVYERDLRIIAVRIEGENVALDLCRIDIPALISTIRITREEYASFAPELGAVVRLRFEEVGPAERA